MLSFLSLLFDKGLSYSTINSTRSALSALGILINGIPVGSDENVKRFMKGVYLERPPQAKYKEIWDINVVVKHLKSFPQLEKLSLKELTLKLVMLLAITTAARVDTLFKLSVDNYIQERDFILLKFDSPLKQSKVGEKLGWLKVESYPEDKDLCVFTILKHYLEITKGLRKSDKLFVSIQSPHKAVTKQTISRWLKIIMQKSGIDVKKYGVHSTRGAASSKAFVKHVPVDEILDVGGWRRETTFNKHYNLQIGSNRSLFVSNILT